MCLITFAWRAHPRFELVLAANRDEFHGRPTAPAHAAQDDPAVVGGRDALQGGGWLQVHARGRLAAVTNVRDGLQREAAARSRGELVHAFVRDPAAASAAWPDQAGDFGRFNLIAWDAGRLEYAGNHPRFRRHAVAPGLHALSNGELDAPWPKARQAQDALARWLASGDAGRETPALDGLFAALADTRLAADADLPDTGVGLELERRLSAPFILGDTYGTRCSTVVLVEAGAITFVERRFAPGGAYAGQSRFVLERQP
jgi:uncharacterized protein with NRDE domain